MAALNAIIQVELHIVAQVVKAELVIGAVSDVGAICFLALHVVKVVHDDANRQAKEVIELAHPLRVALGQVIVDRNHVYAASGERVEVNRQGCDQRLTFTGLHLGDLALVQNGAADELHIEVPHVQDAPAGFANNGEGLRQKLVKSCLHCGVFFVGIFDRVHAFADALAELFCLGAKLLVGELLHRRLKRINLPDQRHDALDFPFVTGAEDGGNGFIKQCDIP